MFPSIFRSFNSTSPIVVSRHFALDVVVCPKPGAAAPRSLAVDATMPAHRHGMNYRPTITAAGVEVAKQPASLLDGSALAFLLDVHVEGVEVDFQGGAADVLDHLEGLIGGIDKVGLETIEGFEANLAALLFSVFADGLQVFDYGGPLLLVVSGFDCRRAPHG